MGGICVRRLLVKSSRLKCRCKERIYVYTQTDTVTSIVTYVNPVIADSIEGMPPSLNRLDDSESDLSTHIHPVKIEREISIANPDSQISEWKICT